MENHPDSMHDVSTNQTQNRAGSPQPLAMFLLPLDALVVAHHGANRRTVAGQGVPVGVIQHRWVPLVGCEKRLVSALVHGLLSVFFLRYVNAK